MPRARCYGQQESSEKLVRTLHVRCHVIVLKIIVWLARPSPPNAVGEEGEEVPYYIAMPGIADLTWGEVSAIPDYEPSSPWPWVIRDGLVISIAELRQNMIQTGLHS